MKPLRNVRLKPIVLIFLFFIILSVVGFATIRDYGAPFDEYVEISILKSNIKEYALRISNDAVNGFTTLGATRISNSIEKDHGIAAYYPLAVVLPALEDNPRQLSYVWSVLTWAWFMVGCISIYAILRAMRSTRIMAALGTLLLYLAPRFFAEGHYNNKDVILLCLVLLTVWLGIRLFQSPGFLKGLLFSFFGAMATNMKIAGVLPWGLIGLALVLAITLRRQWNLKMAGIALITVCSFICFYFLLTPAAWDDPVGFIQYLMTNASHFSRYYGIVIFRGATFWDIGGETPLPWYYIPYYVLVTVPLYTLALTFYGQVKVIRSLFTERLLFFKENRNVFLLVFSLLWIIPMAIAVFLHPLVYNGWRHFYFMYAGIVILAGYGLQSVWDAVRKARMSRVLTPVLIAALCVCFGGTAIGVAENHPFQYAYLNALQQRDAQYTMELDYWNESDSGAFIRLYNLRKEQPGKLTVGCYFNDITIGAMKLPDKIYHKLEITTNTDDEYLYYNSTYVNVFGVKAPPVGYHVLSKITSYGNTVGVLYEKDQ